MARHWEHRELGPSRGRDPVYDPRPGDHILWVDYLWESKVYCEFYAVDVNDHGVLVMYIRGSHRAQAVHTLEQWQNYCRMGHRRGDRTAEGKRKFRWEARVETGNGVFVEPPVIVYKHELPEPYTGPVCGEVLEAPYPTELLFCAHRGQEPRVETFTCKLLPDHEEDEHWDSRMFIGWVSGYDWRETYAQIQAEREQKVV